MKSMMMHMLVRNGKALGKPVVPRRKLREPCFLEWSHPF